mmetsp:Transcript_28203/g.62226  ORF Transcript_28203/g.62226 Transcript_28203/m.62226 type:complete len:260 (-) Transcript_28203:586-1365(-)
MVCCLHPIPRTQLLLIMAGHRPPITMWSLGQTLTLVKVVSGLEEAHSFTLSKLVVLIALAVLPSPAALTRTRLFVRPRHNARPALREATCKILTRSPQVRRDRIHNGVQQRRISGCTDPFHPLAGELIFTNLEKTHSNMVRPAQSLRGSRQHDLNLVWLLRDSVDNNQNSVSATVLTESVLQRVLQDSVQLRSPMGLLVGNEVLQLARRLYITVQPPVVIERVEVQASAVLNIIGQLVQAPPGVPPPITNHGLTLVEDD